MRMLKLFFVCVPFFISHICLFSILNNNKEQNSSKQGCCLIWSLLYSQCLVNAWDVIGSQQIYIGIIIVEKIVVRVEENAGLNQNSGLGGKREKGLMRDQGRYRSDGPWRWLGESTLGKELKEMQSVGLVG